MTGVPLACSPTCINKLPFVFYFKLVECIYIYMSPLYLVNLSIVKLYSRTQKSRLNDRLLEKRTFQQVAGK